MQMPAWTHSRLDAFKTCPKRFYHISVAKDVVEPPSEAQLWGTNVHTALENRLKHGTPLPTGMTQWEHLMTTLEALPGEKHCEVQLSVDRDFQPAPWDQSWSRGIADLLVVDDTAAGVFDYKTGKRKLSSQLRLYAAKTFAYYPKVKVVTTGFIWLKDKIIDKEKFTRDDVSAIWNEYLPTVRRLELAYEKNEWPAQPSGLCRNWCPVGRALCKYCGK